MSNHTKIIMFVAICSSTILLVLAADFTLLRNTIEDHKAIEKRAYEKLTKENKELIEYIIFGEKQD